MKKEDLLFDQWRLQKTSEVRKSLMEEFNISSPEGVTKINKVIISSSVSQATTNKQLLDNTRTIIEKIVGQKTVVNKAKRSITSFKLREGMPIGCQVTLRKAKAWNFLFKLIFIYIPSIRDLRGFSTHSFDQVGNYNIGISDFTIFPESVEDFQLIFKGQGLQININFTSSKKEENLEFLKILNFPFREIGRKQQKNGKKSTYQKSRKKT